MTRRLLMIFVTLAALIVGLATTSTAVSAKIQPNFTCPSPGVCIFHGNNWDGYEHTYIPSQDGGHWINLTNPPGSFNLPWGSINNNSGSDVFFTSYVSNGYGCAPAGARWNGNQVAGFSNYRYMWIEYGVNANCHQLPPHDPSGGPM